MFVGIILLMTLFAACSKDENNTTPVVEQTVTGEVSGTWTKGSIIQVKTDIIIPAGKSLTIEEGVTVVMDTTAKPEVIVNGNLYVLGSTANPVKLTVPEGARITKNKFGKLWGGLSYRRSFDGAEYVKNPGQPGAVANNQKLQWITPFLGLNFKQFMVGYSYNQVLGNVKFDNAGYHQITIGLNLFCKPKAFDCNCPAVSN